MLAHRALGFAEASEGVGLSVRVVELLEERESLLVAGDGLGVSAEVVQGLAEAVPGGRLAVTVADALVQGQNL
ncbi:hypothetical protein GCM10023074_34410 [Microbispora amethystogenes]|uniref:Uncharacterized protein n=1 Tax=Microbispora amethystogenes TaxID=1427754 RepID=A0ABQ4FAP5_9ACTN|nr:hypothetical protein Mam01_20590 [Microbispora amethystogenes]